ncbi:MAG: spore maturation protein [Eubacteriales bacterium]|nr:spore maturation protein [Eubacteriales bacterium]
MHFFNFISVFLIPFVIFYIVVDALLYKKPVFELFIKGGKQGLLTVYHIAPTIIGLLVAVGIFRNSGALDMLCHFLEPVTKFLHIPSALLPLSFLKTVSASGANGLLFDIFKTYGTDSYIGFSASILLSCTETLFYTISVYYMSIQIKKSRWTIPVGIFIATCSLFISLYISKLFFQS